MARPVAIAITAAVALTGCSGEGGSGLPTTLPTTLPSVSLPSVTLPSVTLPSVTLPTVTLPDVTLPTVTGPTVTGPTVTVTENPPEPTTEEPAPSPTEEETAEPEETVAAEPPESTDDAADDDGGSGWLWLLLLLAAVAAVAAVVALVRRRRARAAWSQSVEEILPEAIWLRDSIVPDLLAEGPDGRAGIWVVTRQRVVGLEEDLRRLVTDAPDPALARPVEALTTAVEALRRLLDQADALAGFGGPSVTAALQ
ncbi:MAG: hypothetical protein WCA30_14645, partial [Dermatophilaceae bacterium]